MPDLPTLIRHALAAGETVQSLQAKSGDVVKYQRWSQLSRGERLTEFPGPATIRAIAKGLGISETQAVMSTARAVGLDVHRRGSMFSHRLPANVDALPVEVQNALLRLMQSIPAAGTAEGDVDEDVVVDTAAYEPGYPMEAAKNEEDDHDTQ